MSSNSRARFRSILICTRSRCLPPPRCPLPPRNRLLAPPAERASATYPEKFRVPVSSGMLALDLLFPSGGCLVPRNPTRSGVGARGPCGEAPLLLSIKRRFTFISVWINYRSMKHARKSAEEGNKQDVIVFDSRGSEQGEVRVPLGGREQISESS